MTTEHFLWLPMTMMLSFVIGFVFGIIRGEQIGEANERLRAKNARPKSPRAVTETGIMWTGRYGRTVAPLIALLLLPLAVRGQEPPRIFEQQGDGPKIEVTVKQQPQLEVRREGKRQAKTGYEFPEGFPLLAGEVEWYVPTKTFDEGIMDGWVTTFSFPQHWQHEFPWKTGGLDRSDNFTTATFYVWPKGAKLEYWTERSRFFSNQFQKGFHKFRLPKGTIFGEVIMVDGVTTEIALLEITVEQDPKFSLWRPFTTLEELRPFLTKSTWTWHRLANPHPAKVIDKEGPLVEIALTKEGIDEVLSRPFVDVLDKPFAEIKGVPTYAPTTTQRGSIVPRSSVRGFFSSKECIACHRTAGMEGRMLDPNPQPDKYGAIRGGGGVFSPPLASWLRDAVRLPSPKQGPPQLKGGGQVFQVRG